MTNRLEGRAFIFGIIVMTMTPCPVSPGKPEAEAPAPTDISQSSQPGWTPRAITGAYTGNNQSEGYVEFLAPVWSEDDTILFLYPRLGLSSDVDPGFSAGLGLRHYFEDLDAIAGGHLFYDRYASRYGNYYDQLGIGAEILTHRVDLRFNYYLPESDPRPIGSEVITTHMPESISYGAPFAIGHSVRQSVTRTQSSVTQFFERYEDSMDGFDAEIGILTPWIERYVDLRFFAGYYQFESPYGDDLEGMKARAELRLSSKLALEAAWHEDEELTGDHWIFGIRANIPVYMENLDQGRSPFQGSFSGLFDGIGRNSNDANTQRASNVSYLGPASKSVVTPRQTHSRVRARMTEEILRRPLIHTAESDFIENLAARDVIRVTETEEIILESGLVFVHNRLGRPKGKGTFEDPARTIQRGVNRASTLFGNQGRVLVAGTGTNYNEDVIVQRNSVRILGGGRGVITYGKKPVLDGGFRVGGVPAFRIENFNIRGGASRSGAAISLVSVRDIDIRHNRISRTPGNGIQTLIGGKKAARLVIRDNVIQRTGRDGVFLATRGNARVDAEFIRNRVRNAKADGIHLLSINNSRIGAAVIRNRVTKAGEDGIRFDAGDRSQVNAIVANNRVSRTGLDGFIFNLVDNASANLLLVGNSSKFAGQDAFDFETSGSRFNADIVANRAIRPIDDAFDFFFSNSSRVSLRVESNLLKRPGSDGMEFDLADNSRTRALIESNQVAGTDFGEGIEIDQEGNSRVSIRILENRITNSGTDPLDIDLDDASTGRYQVARNRFRSNTGSIDIDTEDTSKLGLQFAGNTSNADFVFDELGASTFLLEDTLGTNNLNGGAVLLLDPSIPPLVPPGSLGFPTP